jgi:hypothetical protein
MKKYSFFTAIKAILVFVLFSFTKSMYAQQSNSNTFSKNIQFGGGVGLNFGSGFTDISVSPSAIYNLNQYVALGASLQFVYYKSCKTEDEIRRYFYRFGILIFGSYILNTNDLHEENVIAAGEYPIIIDAETILDNRRRGRTNSAKEEITA